EEGRCRQGVPALSRAGARQRVRKGRPGDPREPRRIALHLRAMRVLGLETSCDETAAAVVETDEGLRGRVLADVVHTQTDVHEKWGGVVPELASRDHLQRVLPVLDEALRKSGCALPELDGISVTRGPGLVGALLVGVQVGKSLSAATGIPLVGVNHIEGHLLAVLLAGGAPKPPWLGLVVSGGHTSL